MASLPSVPWTDIEDFRVEVDAPVSTNLMTDIVVDLNYLKAVLTDGATAPQSIVTDDITAEGNVQVDGNLNVDGFISGNFFDSSQLLLLMM